MSVKQVIVMRKDLNMRRGKQIAQGAHAAMKVFFDRLNRVFINPTRTDMVFPVNPIEESWITGNFKKVCVYVNSEEELIKLYDQAKEENLPCSLITDNGLTEFNGVPTKTCIAIGPDHSEKIDQITGGLPLL